MDILDIILNEKASTKDVESVVKNFKSIFAEDNVAVQTANTKAKQIDELEKLKIKHEREVEQLKDRHERENDRLKGAKEKETQDVAIQKKREADRKANESLEEGKLVSDIQHIIDTVMKKINNQVGKEITRNQEKGLGMLNTLGSFVGAKVTDKKQGKGKLFLKFGEETEEGYSEDKKVDLPEMVNINKLRKLPDTVQKQIMSAKKEYDTAWSGVFVPMGDEGTSQRKFYEKQGQKFKDASKRYKALLTKHKVMAEETEEGYSADRNKKTKQTLKKHDKRMIKISRDSIKKYEKGRKEETEVEEGRNYRKEYDNYHSSPEQIKRRAKRNEARRTLKNRKDIKGKDVHHKDNNPMNNDKSNLSIVSQKFNRTEPRLRTEKLSKDATIGDFIKDFQNSDAPQFKNQSAEEIKKMAVAAYYANQKRG